MMSAVIATFRVAQQTGRWSRFASVTVDVVPAAADEVTVAPGVFRHPDPRYEDVRFEDLRHEAVRGVREGLLRVPAEHGGHRVTVVGAVTSEADTGVGDVFEATAQAVRQALSLAPVPPAGFDDPRIIEAWLRSRFGGRFAGVTEARHEHDLLHAWLHFEHHPTTWLHGRGDDLEPTVAGPYPSYGEVLVAPADASSPLSRLIGQRLIDAALIHGPFGGATCAGMLLRLDDTDLAIATVADEWVITLDRVAPYLHPQPWIGES